MYKTYVMLRYDMNNGRHYNGCNWAFDIIYILDELGCAGVKLYQDTIPIYLPVLKERIFDQYKQLWYSNVCNSSKLMWYSHFKQTLDHQCEQYLRFIDNPKYRRALCQFRVSSHVLEIQGLVYQENNDSVNFLLKSCGG